MAERRAPLAAALAAAVLLAAAPAARPAGAQATGEDVKLAFAAPLPNLPGQTLSAVVVTYAPGGRSVVHRHPGSVFVYILSGAIRSEVSGVGPARTYRAGETFFEPPGSAHLVSENASATEPASLLAVFVAPDGAALVMPGR